jgi:hypothetical protein
MAIYLSKGVTLSVCTTAGSVTPLVKLAQILSVDGPSSTVDSVETTNLDSARHEYRPGLPDGGEVGLDLEFDPGDTGHVFLRGAADAPDIYTFQTSYPTLPKATLDTYLGFVTEFAPKSGAPGEKMTASCKIKVVSAVVTTTAP